MAIEISCPSCLAKLRVPDDAGGKQVRCPSCTTVFTAATPAAAAAPFAPPAGASSDVNPYQPSGVAEGDNPFRNSGAPPGQLTPQTLEAFAATRPWVLFMAVMGFLGAALYGLAAIVMFLGGLLGPMGAQAFVAVPMGLGAALFFWISLLLWRYAQNLGAFRDTGNYAYLEQAVVAQCSYWRVVGVMVIIGFTLGLLLPCLGGFMGAISHR